MPSNRNIDSNNIALKKIDEAAHRLASILSGYDFNPSDLDSVLNLAKIRTSILKSHDNPDAFANLLSNINVEF